MFVLALWWNVGDTVIMLGWRTGNSTFRKILMISQRCTLVFVNQMFLWYYNTIRVLRICMWSIISKAHVSQLPLTAALSGLQYIQSFIIELQAKCFVMMAKKSDNSAILYLCFPPPLNIMCLLFLDRTQRQEREVMLKLKGVVDKQRDELRAKVQEIATVSKEVEAVRKHRNSHACTIELLKH